MNGFFISFACRRPGGICLRLYRHQPLRAFFAASPLSSSVPTAMTWVLADAATGRAVSGSVWAGLGGSEDTGAGFAGFAGGVVSGGLFGAGSRAGLALRREARAGFSFTDLESVVASASATDFFTRRGRLRLAGFLVSATTLISGLVSGSALSSPSSTGMTPSKGVRMRQRLRRW